MRRPQSTLTIIGLLFAGLLLACIISAVLGLVWYAIYGTSSSGVAPTLTP